MKNKENNSDIRIYVACLAAYNNAILHGQWIDATQDVADIHKEIRNMLKASPIEDAEEYAIHDYEGFEGVQISEYSSIDIVAELATFIEKHGELGGHLLAHYDDIKTAETALENHYYGAYASVKEFAEEFTEQTTEIPESLSFYIDYKKMARDLEINDILSFETSQGDFHIFWQH